MKHAGLLCMTLLTVMLAGTIPVSDSLAGTITGMVVDDTDGLPLPGANISVKGTANGSISGQDGRFRIENVQQTSPVIVTSYLGYVTEEFPVAFSGDDTARLTIRLQPGLLVSEEITVVGTMLKGQAKALNQQKNNLNVTNVVAADQIGKFPDANVGDALKRIPGISVFGDQGEARFGHVRGTEPRFNSVTVNGERIPSAEAENRTIQLDLVPADMIQTIEVTKALTPDMDADAIGGSINLVTKVPAEERISLNAGGGYNLIEETGGGRYQVGGTYGNRFSDDRLGVLFSMSYDDNDFGSDDIEAEWGEDDGNILLDEFQERTYDVRRIRRSFSTALDYRFNDNHVLKFTGIYNWRSDYENRFRTKYKDLLDDTFEIVREVKGGTKNDARLEDQKMMSFALGGEHDFGRLDMDWQAAYSKASEDRPNERYLALKTEVDASAAAIDISNPSKPFVSLPSGISGGVSDNGLWELDELTEEHQYTEDIDKNFALNFTYDVSDEFTLKFGGKIRDKQKRRDNEFYEYEPVDDDAEHALLAQAFSNLEDMTKENFLPDDKYEAGTFVSNEFLGSIDLDSDDFEKTAVLEELAGNFDAKEQVKAAYLMGTWELTDRTTLLGGARLEHTSNEYEAYRFVDEETPLEKVTGEDASYTNVLPYVHLRYRLNDLTNVKLAYTHSLARPNYFDLAPYTIIDEDEYYFGNPDLEPTLSKNVDLMIEHYLSDVGILSAGVFYKSISDFIVTRVTEDGSNEYYMPVNAGDGTLTGIETAAQFQLPFIPGLGLYLNYTYTHSEIDNFSIEGREGDDLPLPGSPEHTANASIAYEKGPFNIRLSANYHSDFIDSEEGAIGEEEWEDRYYDEAFHLDLNGGYRLSDIVQLYVEVSNLTNEPMRFYQGSEKYVAQDEYYDRKFLVGIKADW
ncbi:TonB-dependent receptor [Prosthecochloris sp. N3]|uniref:TonB-dependent receptor n=1 Tax=Prosthecochloris ethylica TaxID=2743976 RepID=A0ABR9XSU7_9CHLB|nr:TonB-dependent receptor [Prosthecochloris ethylica]MBF0585951.1 TonB-dependent receptor [Prosthecochloris ethylica]MBF0637044.1 TonB-dependent receptor [Prosthecochloris ethylica]NUK47281.1 TonB-dependent receptor [Prosthecochloris ethylica]